MDDVVPISLRRLALEAAKECVTGHCAIYMVLSTLDSGGQRVECERLLLPFGTGSKVEKILASVQLTQVPGGINRSKIVSDFEFDAKLILAGRIETGFSNSRVASTDATAAVNELRRAMRRKMNKAAYVRFGKHRKSCAVANISSTGALIVGEGLSNAPDLLFLRLEMESAEKRCRVVWRKKASLGVQFV